MLVVTGVEFRLGIIDVGEDGVGGDAEFFAAVESTNAIDIGILPAGDDGFKDIVLDVIDDVDGGSVAEVLFHEDTLLLFCFGSQRRLQSYTRGRDSVRCDSNGPA